MFSPALVAAEDLWRASEEGSFRDTEDAFEISEHRLPANIKVVWDESDNREEENSGIPILRIDVGEEALLFAGWSNAGLPVSYRAEGRVKLVEMSWGVYARSSCRQQIENLDPEIVVFSPGRLTVAEPRDRSELTYLAERTYSSSICGGFLVENIDSAIRIGMMKPFLFERGE